MQIENQFQVSAPPETVFSFLLDINRVVGCMPGAELSEVVDPSTFKGKVKIKVGPITVAYNGTAKIVEKDETARVAKLEASGRETTGPGSANATATMSVLEDGAGSTVKLLTDFTVAGRVANFGRGVMEDVSRRLVGQMADCIKSNLEGANTAPAAEVSAAEMPAASPAPAPVQTATPAQAKPVNALALFFQVLWDRIRRLFGSR
ncbi:MAG TPA: SRPBCC family protein [Candidatus Dormibacteraeota bacterium]